MNKRDAIHRATQDQQPHTSWDDTMNMWHQRPNGPLNRSQLKIVRIEHALLILGVPFYEAVKYAENECHELSLTQAVYSYPFTK